MDELITTFHIDWKLMVAQLVNFVIVFAVLWKFALKPLMKTMAERTNTIEKSLRDAEETARRVLETDAEVQQKLTEARAQSLAILNDAKKAADAHRQGVVAKTKQEAAGIVASAKEQMQREREQMLIDAKNDLAGLVVTGVEKVVGKTLDEKADKKIISGYLKNL